MLRDAQTARFEMKRNDDVIIAIADFTALLRVLNEQANICEVFRTVCGTSHLLCKCWILL